MGYGPLQGIGVARLVETKTTRLAFIREIHECKPAFGHVWLELVPVNGSQLSASQAFDVTAMRLRHRNHDIVAEGIERGPFLVLVSAAVIDTRNARLVATDVVYNGLDDMRLHPSVCHSCGGCAAKIV